MAEDLLFLICVMLTFSVLFFCVANAVSKPVPIIGFV